MDHIISMSQGGAHSLAKMTPACSACNQSKKHRLLLFPWAPVLLGGRPRDDKTAPRGSSTTIFRSGDYRTDQGPLSHVVGEAVKHPALLRVIRSTEAAQEPTAATGPHRMARGPRATR